MKSSRRSSFSSSTVTYTLHSDQSTPPSPSKPETQQVPPVAVNPPPRPGNSAAAARIQSAYRAHVIRSLTKTVSAVNSEANELQGVIQRQETVDAMRRSEREKVRMNEALMGLLLRLDSVPGVDPTVREARRKVSRRIVGLQEIVDAICEAKVEVEGCGYEEWGDGFLRSWDRTLEMMEEDMCRERGGEDMERFCAQYLGFRCFQRFLHEP